MTGVGHDAVAHDAERFALLLGLALFFGFAFEEFYHGELPRHPGGVRTFPLLAMAGGALFALEPRFGAAFVAGLLVVGAWIYAYLRREFEREGDPGEGTLIVPACNLLAYVLGAIALTQPLWLSVSLAVVTVLLLGSKRTLHDWSQRVPGREIVTAAQFLILVGVVLPLLAGQPAIPHTTITPFGVWLAVVAVSTISYASYVLSHYVFPSGGTLLAALLGGLYSSTAATVVLARRSSEQGMTPEIDAGIVAATGMMYARLLVVCGLFDAALARLLVAPFLLLGAVTLAIAWLRARSAVRTDLPSESPNPLQLTTAIAFAILLVVISFVTAFVRTHLGRPGVFGLAAVVGVTDIDPFVLSLAQGGAAGVGLHTAAMAIVIAASSNNVLKAAYAYGFSRRPQAFIPAAILLALALLGVAVGAAFVL